MVLKTVFLFCAMVSMETSTINSGLSTRNKASTYRQVYSNSVEWIRVLAVPRLAVRAFFMSGGYGERV